jgi:hypothetical protein
MPLEVLFNGEDLLGRIPKLLRLIFFGVGTYGVWLLLVYFIAPLNNMLQNMATQFNMNIWAIHGILCCTLLLLPSILIIVIVRRIVASKEVGGKHKGTLWID